MVAIAVVGNFRSHRLRSLACYPNFPNLNSQANWRKNYEEIEKKNRLSRLPITLGLLMDYHLFI